LKHFEAIHLYSLIIYAVTVLFKVEMVCGNVVVQAVLYDFWYRQSFSYTEYDVSSLRELPAGEKDVKKNFKKSPAKYT
jgi:hypothetical protein